VTCTYAGLPFFHPASVKRNCKDFTLYTKQRRRQNQKEEKSNVKQRTTRMLVGHMHGTMHMRIFA
jgi:hypothetical protein